MLFCKCVSRVESLSPVPRKRFLERRSPSRAGESARYLGDSVYGYAAGVVEAASCPAYRIVPVRRVAQRYNDAVVQLPLPPAAHHLPSPPAKTPTAAKALPTTPPATNPRTLFAHARTCAGARAHIIIDISRGDRRLHGGDDKLAAAAAAAVAAVSDGVSVIPRGYSNNVNYVKTRGYFNRRRPDTRPARDTRIHAFWIPSRVRQVQAAPGPWIDNEDTTRLYRCARSRDVLYGRFYVRYRSPSSRAHSLLSTAPARAPS